MKIINTKKVNYFRDENGFYCFFSNGIKTKLPSLMALKFHSDTLYQLNGKRKIN